MLVILIGPPGSGKGTQGQLLATKLHLPHLSTGDMFREIVSSEEKEGKLLKEYMDQGKLAPVDLVNEIVKRYLSNDVFKNGCILDGYPRNVEQAKFLTSFINQPIKVIYFDIKDETVIKRILGRFSCGICKKNYNLFFHKPKFDNICDECNSSQFTFREDDNEDIIKERLQVYKNETHPLIKYYQDSADFYTIDANKNKDETAVLLLDLLKRI